MTDNLFLYTLSNIDCKSMLVRTQKDRRDNLKRPPLRAKIPLSILLLILAMIIVVVIYFTLELSATRNQNARLIDEVRKTREELDIITQTLSLLARDINDTRSQIGMSHREYPILNQERASHQVDVEANEVIKFWKAINTVRDRFIEEKHLLKFEEFKRSDSWQAFIKIHQFRIEEGGDYSLILYKELNKYVEINYMPESGEVEVIMPSPLTASAYKKGYWNDSLIRFIEDRLAGVKEHYLNVIRKSVFLKSILTDAAVTELLAEKGMTLSKLNEDGEKLSIAILKDRQRVLDIHLSKVDFEISIDGKVLHDDAILLNHVLGAIKDLDLRSDTEKRFAETMNSLLQVFTNEDLIGLMSNQGLSIDTQPRENEYFIYYDIKSDSGRLGSFAVEKYTAEVYLLDKDEVQISTLRQITEENSEEKKN